MFFERVQSWLADAGFGERPLVSDSVFRKIAEYSADMLVLSGPDLASYYVSPSCQEMLGWTAEEFIAAGPLGLIDERDREAVSKLHTSLLQNHDPGGTAIFRMIHKDGRRVWVEARGRFLENPRDHRRRDVVLVIRDVSERKRLEEELKRLAMVDGLTGTANRRAFEEALERDWTSARYARRSLALLLTDIDHFKLFNDEYGHLEGDECLRAVADSLMTSFPEEAATVARYGGEEFCVVLPQLDPARATAAGERARLAVAELGLPHARSVNGGVVTISVGVAVAFPGQDGIYQGPHQLVADVDAALYRAKNLGRNRVVLVDPPVGRRITDRLCSS